MTTHTLCHNKPQYLWCHIHFRQDNTAPVSDIAPPVSMSSHRLHWHLNNFCLTSHKICVTSYELYITSHLIYNIIPNPYVITLLYLKHHSLYIWNLIQYHGSIYTQNVTSQALSLSSHPLYQTSHQLYLTPHKLCTDITPTFVWHHTHYICDIISTIYNHISIAYVITLLYL